MLSGKGCRYIGLQMGFVRALYRSVSAQRNNLKLTRQVGFEEVPSQLGAPFPIALVPIAALRLAPKSGLRVTACGQYWP
jgi:hypothetical protein